MGLRPQIPQSLSWCLPFGTTYMAASYGYLDTVKYLHEMGADLDLVGGPHNDTVLIAATVYGNSLVVQYLVEARVDLNVVDDDGMTALDWAEYKKFEDIVDILLMKE